MDEVTILAVNDNRDHLLLMEMVLRKAGYRVITAANGREALAACRGGRPDVVVSDVMMPVMDGIEFTRALRAGGDAADTPVLLVSALRKDTRSVVEGLEAGADGYIEIPYDPIHLTATLARLVERKRHADEIRGLNERLEDKVRERTAMLEAINRELAREVAERRTVEEELQRAHDAAMESAQLKSEFLANMSHEVRTPMHGVLGMSELLLGTELAPKQREFAEAIHESAGALLAVINDVLDFSKMDAGKLRLERVEFDLREALESALYIFGERAQAKGIDLRREVAAGVPDVVKGDPGRLRQVLTNLVGNAVKFTPAGGVSVTVRPERAQGRHLLLRFEVKDTGIGIESEALKHIFRPFAQADGSTTREYGGTGLGLSISKALVELMGGEIGVESRPGEGSVFWFTSRFELPRAAAGAARADLRGLRALVVDANGSNRGLLTRQLEKWGVRAAGAGAAAEAHALLREAAGAGDPFAFALVDCHLPPPGAYALARLVREAPRVDTRLILFADAAAEGEAGRAGLYAARLKIPMRRQDLYNGLLAVANGGAPPPAGRSATAARAHGREVRLLVAEDNPVNRRLMESMLEDLGYGADFVSDGASALRAAAAEAYALILMDCHMPGVDGFTAAAEIRRGGACEGVPIVALTADAMQGTREKCLAAGMNDYLSKPFSPEQLSSLICRWLGGNGHAAPAASAQTAGAPAGFDPSLLERLSGLDADGRRLSALVAEFDADARRRCAALGEALGRADWGSLSSEAHALKGSASFLGAARVSEACARLLEHCSRADAASARAALSRLDDELAAARREINQFVSERKNGGGA